jgi:hypothetical protein
MAKYKPDGYHTVTPYLTVRGAAQAMEFNQWGLATHTEDLAPDEIARRARAAFAQTESGKT